MGTLWRSRELLCARPGYADLVDVLSGLATGRLQPDLAQFQGWPRRHLGFAFRDRGFSAAPRNKLAQRRPDTLARSLPARNLAMMFVRFDKYAIHI
jgi:hypothetical protein